MIVSTFYKIFFFSLHMLLVHVRSSSFKTYIFTSLTKALPTCSSALSHLLDWLLITLLCLTLLLIHTHLFSQVNHWSGVLPWGVPHSLCRIYMATGWVVEPRLVKVVGWQTFTLYPSLSGLLPTLHYIMTFYNIRLIVEDECLNTTSTSQRKCLMSRSYQVSY